MSSLSLESFASILIDPPILSPVTLNLTYPLFVSITTVSDKLNNSLHILVNSLELIVTIELYCVSGIPKCSESIVRRERVKSLSFLSS